MAVRILKKDFDWLVLLLMVAIVIFGLVMIGDVSLIEAEVKFGDKFHFLKRQSIWALLGLGLSYLASSIDYSIFKKLARVIFTLSLLPLILVLIPGLGLNVYGATRWFNFGLMSFQPIELVKLTSVIYFSALAAEKEKKPLWKQLLMLIIPVFLVLLEPNFGSVVLLVVTVGIIWFLGGESLIKLFSLLIIGLVVGGLLIFTSPYRSQRVMGLLNPFYDPQGKSYHVYQLILTLGSGGLFGRGLGNSRQKYQYLPEITTDSIVALIAEEFGFIGLSLFLLLFIFFLVRCFRVARSAVDPFGQLLAAGITILIAIQGIINLGAVSVIFPLTGIPFPFISYGGSSLIFLMIAVGILLNISKYRRAK